MAAPKVFLIQLRRPNRKDPKEQRDDPFYEFGSFGCTKCHSKNLFNPRNAAKLENARLGFVQGGPQGSRLVFLTPTITVKVWKDCCEARWKPREMPFKYSEAPILVWNEKNSDFRLVERFARRTRRSTVEGGLSSRIRASTTSLPSALAKEIVEVYEALRRGALSSAIAVSYDEALPWPPPVVDSSRKGTYKRRLGKLTQTTEGPQRRGKSPKAKTHFQTRCR